MGTLYDNHGGDCGSYRFGSIYDTAGKKVGYVDDAGRVYDDRGNKKGYVDQHGRVENDWGYGAGSVNGRTIYSKDGFEVGEQSEGAAFYDMYEPYVIREGHRAGAGYLLLLRAA
ncbi:hypothetical protein GCM10022403_033670 [Streptomyces coacervatus]|uniref:WG repeat-containing protein n=2 Tax=Streptomyces coacervatus TaxID=647381 RepID=A0ABP7HQH0_9ACTN|nr:hypothetical protein [Streptomyces coacervatus]MDF2272149.1 hypothetical protein [Streptomyces coacervatus]